ncbi:MAG TPA: ABC transporter permease [Terriglobia bacterium]|jgi:putative ABC transport system permease protein|nr:ABC transporter permease [Terriglobia bacterium]
MNWIKQLRSRRRLYSDFSQEIREHLEEKIDELVASGMSRKEATQAARRDFGNATLIEERGREVWQWPSVESFIADVRYALRMLRKNPGFTVVAVLTLALGIGANTAIFSVVNAVVLRPLPYSHSDRLVWIAESIPALKSEAATGGDYVDWKDQNHTLDRIAAYDTVYRGSLSEGAGGAGSADFNLTGHGTPARVHGAFVSASFFATMGLEPQLGRAFTENEDQPSGPHVVLLTHSFWQQDFGSDAHVLGQTVNLDATPYTVIGVMPASFRFPGDSDAQILLPLALNQASERLRIAQRHVRIIGRLKPGVSLAAARTDLDEIRKRAQPSGGPMQAEGGRGRGRRRATPAPGPDGPPPSSELKVVPLAEHLAGNLRPAMLTLLGAVGLVLLIACANVANLMLTRASSRTREVAVRAVLGAGRWRLVRQLLVESVTLAVAGGMAGLLLAACGVDVIARLIPAGAGGGILAVAAPKVDGNVLLFALAASIFTGILFGLAPAVTVTRSDLAEGLKEGAQVASPGGRRGWLRGALAVSELSLALVLLIGAGLLIKSFYRLLQVNPGFAPERVLTMDLSLTDTRYPSRQQKSEFFSQVLGRVESLPGVRSAALADSLPLSPYQGFLMMSPNQLLPRAALSSSTTVMVSRLEVSPGYFSTLRIPVLQGRTFTDHDDERAPKVAVVNAAVARQFWPAEDPIGKQLANLTVVGVVGNARHEGLSQETEAEFYVPYLQSPANSMQLAVRTAADPDSMVSAVRAGIGDVDPDQPLYHVSTLQEVLSESLAPRRFNMLLLGIFAGIALALATVGIYGVMAFSVTERTHEIGIRMALGAERGNVLRLIVRQGLRLTLLGVILGIAGAWALTSFLASFLFGIAPRDPATFALVSVALVAVSILACYIPARRATRMDPMVALRYE